MSRFKVTVYQWKEDPEVEATYDGYLVEALNPEELNLGHFEGICGGKSGLIQYLEKRYQVKESDLVF